MKKILLLLLALTALAAKAENGPQFIYEDWIFGTVTNVPATLSAGATSNINYIIYTSGGDLSLSPRITSPTSTSTSNFVMLVDFAVDSTFTNWSATTSYTNAATGTTAANGRSIIPASLTQSAPAVRVKSIRSDDTLTNLTVSGISFVERILTP